MKPSRTKEGRCAFRKGENMPSVFLSHSSIDKPFVEKLAKDLMRVGINVWFDKWTINVGDSLTWRIEEGLQENDYLGIVLSPEALESEWVKSELSAAWCRQMTSRKIIVLPIMYRNCSLPLLLADRKYADFRTDYNQGFADLCHALGIKRADTLTSSNWRMFMTDKTVDWKHYREEEFKELVTLLVDRAKEYNWSCWTGGTKNPLSITLSAFVSRERKKSISIRMSKGTYMAADCDAINPNNVKVSEFTIYIGNTVNECEEYVWREMESFRRKFGDPVGTPHYFTQRFLSEREKLELARDVVRRVSWYQNDIT